MALCFHTLLCIVYFTSYSLLAIFSYSRFSSASKMEPLPICATRAKQVHLAHGRGYSCWSIVVFMPVAFRLENTSPGLNSICTLIPGMIVKIRGAMPTVLLGIMACAFPPCSWPNYWMIRNEVAAPRRSGTIDINN